MNTHKKIEIKKKLEDNFIKEKTNNNNNNNNNIKNNIKKQYLIHQLFNFNKKKQFFSNNKNNNNNKNKINNNNNKESLKIDENDFNIQISLLPITPIKKLSQFNKKNESVNNITNFKKISLNNNEIKDISNNNTYEDNYSEINKLKFKFLKKNFSFKNYRLYLPNDNYLNNKNNFLIKKNIYKSASISKLNNNNNDKTFNNNKKIKKSSSCYNELPSLILKKKIFIKKSKKQFDSFNFFAYLKSPWKHKFKITKNFKKSLSEKNILPEINKNTKLNKDDFKISNHQLFKLDLIEKEMNEEFNNNKELNKIINFYNINNKNYNNHNRNREDLKNKNYFSKMNKEISSLKNIKSELEEILKISSIKENEN